MSKAVKLHVVQDVWSTDKDAAEAMLQSLSSSEAALSVPSSPGAPLPPSYLFSKPSTGRVALFIYTLLTLPEQTDEDEYYTKQQLMEVYNATYSTISRYLKVMLDCAELRPYLRTARLSHASRGFAITPYNALSLTQKQFTDIVKSVRKKCTVANAQRNAMYRKGKQEHVITLQENNSAKLSYLEKTIEYKLLSCIFMGNSKTHTYASLVKYVREIGYSISANSIKLLCKLLFTHPAIDRYLSMSFAKQQGSPIVFSVGPTSVSKDMLLHLTQYVFSKGKVIATGDDLDIVCLNTDTPVQHKPLNAITFTMDEPESKFAGAVVSASAIERAATKLIEPEVVVEQKLVDPEVVVEQKLVIEDTGDLLGRALSLYEKALRSSGVTKILTAKVDDTVVLTVSIK